MMAPGKDAFQQNGHDESESSFGADALLNLHYMIIVRRSQTISDLSQRRNQL